MIKEWNVGWKLVRTGCSETPGILDWSIGLILLEKLRKGLRWIQVKGIEGSR